MSARAIIDGQKLELTNGSTPPSGNATTRKSAGTTAAAPTPSASRRRTVDGRDGSCRRPPPTNHAPAPRPRKSPAIGLASVVAVAARQANAGRRWVAASTHARANVTPRAKVRRPVRRLTAVAAANQSDPTRAPRVPKCSAAIRSKSHAASHRGDRADHPRSHQGGQRREEHAVPGHVVPAVPGVVPDEEAVLLEQPRPVGLGGEVGARRIDGEIGQREGCRDAPRRGCGHGRSAHPHLNLSGAFSPARVRPSETR